MIIPVAHPASYNYARIRKMFSFRQAGSVFQWPTKPAESYYLIDAKADKVLFVMPSGIQIFYAGYVVAPGHGIQFVRISEHVVLQLPEYVKAKKDYRQLLEQLGLVVAKTPESDPVDIRLREKSEQEQLSWAKEIRNLGPTFDFDYLNGISEVHLHLLSVWARCADWSFEKQYDVVKALAFDLKGSPGWDALVKVVCDSATFDGFDFEAATLLGQEGKLSKATLYIGSSYVGPEARNIHKRLWSIPPVYRAQRDDQPGTLRRWMIRLGRTDQR